MLAGWGMFSARRILYPERRPTPAPDPLPAYTTHTIATPDATNLEVWRLEAPAPRARILICHGYYADRYQVLGLADALRRRGYEVLLFDMRGHGRRRGPCTLGVKERLDAQAILRWAGRADTLAPLPIGVLGFSMGAAVMCQVAAHEPAVGAIVTDSIYARLFPVIQQTIRERYHLPKLPWAVVTWWTLHLLLCRRLSLRDPSALAPHLHQPLLAIHGGQDRRVAPQLGQAFYQRWAGPKEQWFDPAVAHVKMSEAHPQEYCDRIARFFDRTLPG